jgi:FkbM family methyltransferase
MKKWIVLGLAWLGVAWGEMESHSARLEILKKKGFNPKVIYDIGAYQGKWSQEIEKLFGQARFYLFEANQSNEPFLDDLTYSYYIAALGNIEGKTKFYSNGSTGDSFLKENTEFYAEGKYTEKEIAMTTLSRVVKQNKIPLPDLVKIDVQGAEKMVIEGGLAQICHAEAIVIEASVLEYNKGAPLIFDMMQYMDSLGYRMADILEGYYLPETNELAQLDLLFLKKGSKLLRSEFLE